MNQEKIAGEIIRKNVSYESAYYEMLDNGIENPDFFWNKYIDECGKDAKNGK